MWVWPCNRLVTQPGLQQMDCVTHRACSSGIWTGAGHRRSFGNTGTLLPPSRRSENVVVSRGRRSRSQDLDFCLKIIQGDGPRYVNSNSWCTIVSTLDAKVPAVKAALGTLFPGKHPSEICWSPASHVVWNTDIWLLHRKIPSSVVLHQMNKARYDRTCPVWDVSHASRLSCCRALLAGAQSRSEVQVCFWVDRGGRLEVGCRGSLVQSLVLKNYENEICDLKCLKW